MVRWLKQLINLEFNVQATQGHRNHNHMQSTSKSNFNNFMGEKPMLVQLVSAIGKISFAYGVLTTTKQTLANGTSHELENNKADIPSKYL